MQIAIPVNAAPTTGTKVIRQNGRAQLLCLLLPLTIHTLAPNNQSSKALAKVPFAPLPSLLLLLTSPQHQHCYEQPSYRSETTIFLYRHRRLSRQSSLSYPPTIDNTPVHCPLACSLCVLQLPTSSPTRQRDTTFQTLIVSSSKLHQ